MKYIFLIMMMPLLTVGQSQDKMWASVIDDIDFKKDTVESVFKWVTHNIRYDQKMVPEDGLYTSKIKLVQDALKTGRGVCEHYAELFHGLMQYLGYESIVIGGYVRQNGVINSEFGHVWNAVKLDNKWFLFDPTWASGYTENGKFFASYSEEWYKASPQEFIKTHMPFDPMWQLLDRPYSHSDFISEKFNYKPDPKFEIENDIDEELAKSDLDRLASHIERIEFAGMPNNLTKRRVMRLRQELENRRYNEELDVLNARIDEMNEIVSEFNNYVEARNQGFKRVGWTKNKIEQSAEHLYSRVSELLVFSESLPVYEGTKNQPFSSFKNSINRMSKEVTKVYQEAKNMK
jgi:hypothetical protein